MRIDAAMERISGKVTVAARYLSGAGYCEVCCVEWGGTKNAPHGYEMGTN